jgi:hypothetical protein
MPYLADFFGITGVSLILVAFFLNLFNRISQDAYAYILMNLVGGILACISSVLIQSIAFTILEGTWAVVSAIALIKKRNHDRRNESFDPDPANAAPAE